MFSYIRSKLPDRFQMRQLAQGGDSNAFAEDVRAGLAASPKFLHPKYFYDDLGSKLFEAICRLPEYYLTRAEREILRDHAGEIVGSIEGPARLIEFGSGSAEKTRYLIEALLRKQDELHYLPVDISDASLEASSLELLKTYPKLRITAYASDYFTALRAGGESSLVGRPANRTIALFLGSNIGNFNPEEARDFFRAVRLVLWPKDALLVGADLKKSSDILLPAYDDPLGVTAAFNLNLLARINRELGGDFDIKKFAHQAVYNEVLGRIESYIVSREAQRVRIPALDLEARFEQGETIHTENSYKFDLDQLAELARETGFSLKRVWTDEAGRFSFNLFTALENN
ncbi:MAG TPA: L-histidine N(alpha)-methyltransferase [Blastocatellia bacterium]|nr:L-histidine N(alpha)-methyltransferase [Blastocatellia bacterium]